MPLTTVQQTRLRDDLQGLIKGEVQSDNVTQQLYATDASILQSRPVCVVCPRNTDDVIAVVRYAAASGIPIHPRGAGTSLTGESLGEGIVLVFSRYMRRILNSGDDFVTIQPGLLRRRLNGVLGQSQHRLFGPLAGNVSSASLGSILARNGAGLHYLRYGLPSDHLVSMTVVLANGDLLTLDRNSLIRPLQGNKSVVLAQEIAYGKEYTYAGKIARLLENRSNEQIIESANRLPIDRTGYAEHAVLQGNDTKHVDLARLFAGSEGTLGLIVEATLKMVSQPQRKSAAAFFFNSLSQALETVSVVSPLRPVLCELIDRRRLNMVRDWDGRYRSIIPADAEAALLVELDAGTHEAPMSADDSRDQLKHLIDLVQMKQLCYHALRVNVEQDFEFFDQVIRRSELVLGRMFHSIQSIPLFEDIAVPIDTMNTVVSELFTLLQRYKMTASLSGHVGQGHLRIYPLLDLAQSNLVTALKPLAESVYSMILRYGGTVSSEWGTGLLKSQFLPQQFPHLFSLFRDIKETFDPQYLMNPGKIIPLGTPWTASLRHGLEKRGHTPPNLQWSSDSRIIKQKPPQNDTLPNQVEIQLKWEPSYVFESAYQCNGCGECLRFDRQSRICPLFRGTATIEYAPRSKADLLRGILEQDIDLEELTRERAKEIAATCFQCRMCDVECPLKIDINVLAFRSKAAYAAAHGLSLEDLLFSRLDNVLNLLTPVSGVVNAAMHSRIIRWIFEKTFQIPQRRSIPALAYRPYLHRIRWSPRRHRLLPEQTNKERVAFFVDTFANHFDPQLAELAVQILEYNGFSVHVPIRQRPSGMRSFAVGHASRAERLAQYNIIQMSELIRQGYKIITIEPSTVSCLTKDYQHLMESKESELTAENVFDFCTFLWHRHQWGKLSEDFQRIPYRIGYHAPCRGLALSASLATDVTPAENLLHLIPDLDVQRIEQGCCGMAGFWGMLQKNYRHSLHIGIPLFRALRQPEIDFGVSDCNACCVQMTHGSRKQAIHPIRLLAVAYGLLPLSALKVQ